MKNYVIGLIILAVTTVIGGYVWGGRDGVRTYYQGHVQIEPVSMETIIGKLEKVGCTDQGESCHYIYDKNQNTLKVNSFRKGLKPLGPAWKFLISNDQLFVDFDIEGRKSSKSFERKVREVIQKYGDAVTPIDGTWTITYTRDTTGVIY